MPITEYLERNAKLYANETALVEINPDVQEIRRVTWREYELIERGLRPPIAGRSPGAYSMKRRTAAPTF